MRPKLRMLKMALLLTYLSVVSCAVSPSQTFPDTDIVYQGGEPNSPKLGFVNANGSDNLLLATDRYLAKPIWSANGKTLYALGWSGYGIAAGEISVWREGENLQNCQDAGWEKITSAYVIPASEPVQVVINRDEIQILLVSLKDCSALEKYVDVTQPDQRKFLWGGMLSSDGELLLYAEESDRRSASPKYTIKVMDISNGTVADIGEGINPVWSPDDQWVAYIQLDGIYIMKADGSQTRHLVQYDLARAPGSKGFTPSEPLPRWSPDGKWLVYHKWIKDLPAIFKVEVATGTEVKIVEDGLYPFWRSR